MMGMYDEIRCHIELPVPGIDMRGVWFQTKNLVCNLDRYEIRDDGTLWHEEYDTEDRSDPSETGLLRLRGMMTRVNQRWVQWPDFTGEIRFYGDTDDGQWVEFSSYFITGHMEHLIPLCLPKEK